MSINSANKELKKSIAQKLHNALPELRVLLGEKKFDRKVKKVAKVLIEGLGKKEKVVVQIPVVKSDKKSTKTTIAPKVAVADLPIVSTPQTNQINTSIAKKVVAKKALVVAKKEVSKAPVAKKKPVKKSPVLRKKAVVNK